MAFSVLTTKLYVPTVRAGVVSRRRLLQRLDAGLESRLVLLSAPAGFGKTTLVSEWLSRLKQPSTWLSLDANDNDSAQFFAYFVAALRKIAPGIGEGVLSAVESSSALKPARIIRDLINELSVFDSTFVFVLEDYHLITLAEIHDAMAFLLEHMPPQMRLVIISRSDPPISLSRYRAGGVLAEIRGADLCFSVDEATSFLNETMGLGLPPDAVEALTARTEGWIAGLQLAAVSMMPLDAVERASFIEAFAGTEAFVLDYLVEEVLNRQPSHLKSFLLLTSVLEHLSGPLCDSVLESWCEAGKATPLTGQEILQYLERHNLFVVPLDNRRQWYRYHHLFADLLRNQLEVSRPELVPALHQRASAWYEREDRLTEAIAHSLKAGDFVQAARLTEKTFFDRMSHGEDFTTMLARLQALPGDIIRKSPNLAVWYAWMLSLDLQLDAAEHYLEEVERNAGQELSEDHRLQIDVIHAELARHRKDLPRSIGLCRGVLEHIDRCPSDQILRLQARTGAVHDLAWAYLERGEMAEAERWFLEALQISRNAGSTTLILLAYKGLAMALRWQGRLDQAEEYCRRGLHLISGASSRTYGDVVPAAAYIYLELGELLRERDRLEKAAAYLARGTELGEQSRIDGATLRDGYISHARLQQARGDLSAAMEEIRRAERLSERHRVVPRFSSPVVCCRQRLRLARRAESASGVHAGHSAPDTNWSAAHGLTDPGEVESLHQEIAWLVWARMLAHAGRHRDALDTLDSLIKGAEEHGRIGHLIEILVLRALVLQSVGRDPEAVHALERALGLAEPGGYIRIFVDEGTRLADLLRQLAAHDALGRYAMRLLSVFDRDAEKGPADRRQASAGMAETLSLRELEVLRLLAAELTGARIAERLFISLNTVKTHIKNIYGKLGARSRYEALERARELYLID